IYIGTAGLDPETNPQAAYFDKELTIPALQPIRTLNGYPVSAGAPAVIYTAQDSFSITVRNSASVLMHSSFGVFSQYLYDNTSSGLTATNMQDAIDEVLTSIGVASGLSLQKTGGTMTGHIEAIPGASGVQVPQAQETAMLATTQLAGHRNKIINGNFAINQRGYVSGTATTTSNEYTLDRWRVVTSGQSITFTASGNGNIVTAPAGGIEQVIEGGFIEGGTFVLNWTGTATATVNGVAVAKGGTVTLTAATNATVKFSGGTVSLVQVEAGSVATLFEHRLNELQLCEKYYFRARPVDRYYFSAHAAGCYHGFPISFPVTMRATPTVIKNIAGITYTSASSLNVADQTKHGAVVQLISTGAAVVAIAALGANDYFDFSAEI
ncbi:hypothetical protein, partial [Pseudomonas sp.]|uniref:hypothetical protein n=1 Tax=Pseudomonas sp. TaxID=306 RepID=UPI00258A8483